VKHDDRIKLIEEIIPAGLGVFAASLLFLFAFASSDLESAADCNSVCTRYQSCFDASYDTAACEARCRESAGSKHDYLTDADTCNTCLSAKSCASATSDCTADCAGIVP
jgi:hypothetical protein